jgi:hypothetical protein
MARSCSPESKLPVAAEGAKPSAAADVLLLFCPCLASTPVLAVAATAVAGELQFINLLLLLLWGMGPRSSLPKLPADPSTPAAAAAPVAGSLFN